MKGEAAINTVEVGTTSKYLFGTNAENRGLCTIYVVKLMGILLLCACFQMYNQSTLGKLPVIRATKKDHPVEAFVSDVSGLLELEIDSRDRYPRRARVKRRLP